MQRQYTIPTRLMEPHDRRVIYFKAIKNMQSTLYAITYVLIAIKTASMVTYGFLALAFYSFLSYISGLITRWANHHVIEVVYDDD